MKPEIEAVVRLQSLDDRAAILQKDIDALPRHVAEIERKLEAHKRRLDADRAALAVNQKTRKSLEDDSKMQEQKITKLKDQMLQAKNNEQYRAFEKEIAFCESEIRKSEDRILQLMGEAEPLDKNVKTAQTALSIEQKSVEAEQENATKQTAEDKAALSAILAERQILTASIPAPVLAQYTRARKRWHNSGVADATSRRCSACNIGLRPQFYQDLKNGEKVISCESCGRILYYNPPVDLEHELHQKV